MSDIDITSSSHKTHPESDSHLEVDVHETILAVEKVKEEVDHLKNCHDFHSFYFDDRKRRPTDKYSYLIAERQHNISIVLEEVGTFLILIQWIGSIKESNLDNIFKVVHYSHIGCIPEYHSFQLLYVPHCQIHIIRGTVQRISFIHNQILVSIV